MALGNIKLNNGQYAGRRIAEITSIPYYRLLEEDVQQANYSNQIFFTQLINSVHRRDRSGNLSIELLFISLPVSNQTYKAQVKAFLILRGMDKEENILNSMLTDIVRNIQNDFEAKGFSLAFLDDDGGEEFSSFTEQIDASTVLAISRKEQAVVSALTASGSLYYTNVIYPSENANISVITNALSQNPNCAVSLQLIPTSYTNTEIAAIEETKKTLDYYASTMLYKQGIRLDASVQSLVDSYKALSESQKEMLFYFNFLIYSRKETAFDLANKIIDLLEEDDKPSGSGYEITDITQHDLHPGKNVHLSPWANSNLLIYKLRKESTYWSQKNAPLNLVRLRYLMTSRQIRPVFKIPIDDGKTIGFEVRKLVANREKLHGSVISEDNFKLGVIQNTMRADSHAGVALNDFTKHGLIVGMPGSGKTNFSLGLLLQFWNDFRIPFLAVEPTKSEYRSLIDGIKELQIFTPGKSSVSPYIINPFIPPKGVTVESFVPSLMTAFKAAFSMPNPLPDIFLAAINDCYNAYGWKMNSTADDPDIEYFGLYEFIKVFKQKIQHMDYKGEVKANMESAGVVRLISLIEQNSNIYDTIHTIPLEDLLSKPTVIELNAINNKEQKSLIMALLLILICVYTKNNIAGDGKLKNILLIDEAHVLLAGSGTAAEDSADSQGSTIEALEDMIAEIRSYGTGIIIADQSPTKVGRNIIANTNVKVIFKLVEKENRDAISTATNMEEADYDLLGRLGIGEAILHYGRIYTPLHIKTYNVAERAKLRPVVSDTEVASLSSYWRDKEYLLVPYRECAYNCECNRNNYSKCDFTVKANADFLASRLINRYFYGISDKTAFAKLLGSLDAFISNLLQEVPNIPGTPMLVNCTKIKFLRKAMLIKDFGIGKAEYDKIAAHKNFLRSV